MSILAPPATLQALGGNLLPHCQSRSLFKDRFSDPQAKEEARKRWFTSLIGRKAEARPRAEWLPSNALQLHARLLSRLMVDLSGGVMENANLNLDRYGLPLIPGSAVKGCARRMALQALHDWIEAGTDRPATDDACAPCCDGLTKPAEMLAAIARIFGWTPKDWSDPSDRSDFAWATHGDQALLQSARALLPTHDTFAGTIAFLAASPNCDPGLELDVVTPHHTKYYQGDPAYSTAPDTEDPIPVFFPAVKPQSANDHFTFPLIPLRLAKDGDLAHAKRWLAHGLELLGLGAKTNAGYGVFQILSDGHPLFPDRFAPQLSPVESFLKDWGGKPINSMNVRSFAKRVGDFDAPALVAIFAAIAPDKTGNFKDPFWNPFKAAPAGKALLDKIRFQP